MWGMHVVSWISKATSAKAHAPAPSRTRKHRHVIFIAFPRQQWFRERASLLRYTYIACPVSVYNFSLMVQTFSKEMCSKIIVTLGILLRFTTPEVTLRSVTVYSLFSKLWARRPGV